MVRYNLGLAHADANGTHRSLSHDWVLALEYLGLAGEQGHLAAYLSIGEVHLQMAEARSDEAATAHERVNATKAFEKAKVQLVESAKAGNVDAQRRLGGMYNDGHEHVRIDVHGLKAFKWYERAASQGCKESMAKVSQFYANGIRATDDGKGGCMGREQQATGEPATHPCTSTHTTASHPARSHTISHDLTQSHTISHDRRYARPPTLNRDEAECAKSRRLARQVEGRGPPSGGEPEPQSDAGSSPQRTQIARQRRRPRRWRC